MYLLDASQFKFSNQKEHVTLKEMISWGLNSASDIHPKSLQENRL